MLQFPKQMQLISIYPGTIPGGFSAMFPEIESVRYMQA